jgi:hypothetical protein
MISQEKKTRQLAEAVESLMCPISGVPFRVAIKALYGFQVIPLT